MQNALTTIYSAAVFSVLLLGGLAVLRSQRNIVVRAILFVAICAVAVRLSFWLSVMWSLDAVALGVAWAVAFLVLVGAEAITRVRRRAGT